MITSPHNPTGVAGGSGGAGRDRPDRGTRRRACRSSTRSTRTSRAIATPPAAARGDVFVTTSSLTKSYGLSSLRAGWVIASPRRLVSRPARARRRRRHRVDRRRAAGDARLRAPRRAHGARPRRSSRATRRWRTPSCSRAPSWSGRRRPGRSSFRASAASRTPRPFVDGLMRERKHRARPGRLLRGAGALPSRLRRRHREDPAGLATSPRRWTLGRNVRRSTGSDAFDRRRSRRSGAFFLRLRELLADLLLLPFVTVTRLYDRRLPLETALSPKSSTLNASALTPCASRARSSARSGSSIASSVSWNVPKCMPMLTRARDVEVRADGLVRVHVHGRHEPARLVGADREQRDVDRRDSARRSPRSAASSRNRPRSRSSRRPR